MTSNGLGSCTKSDEKSSVIWDKFWKCSGFNTSLPDMSGSDGSSPGKWQATTSVT